MKRPVNVVLRAEIRANARWLSLVLFLMLLVVGFDVIAPWPFKILIDDVLGSAGESGGFFLSRIFHSRALLGFFAVFLYFISTFSLEIVQYLNSATTKKVIKNITTHFSKAAFEHLQALTIGFYRKQQIGDYIYRLSYDVSALGSFLEEGILPLITSLLYVGATVTIMFFINVKLTLFSLIALPFLALGLYFFNLYTVFATERSEILNSATFSFIEEALSHLKIIQAFSQERRESKTFNRKVDASLESDVISYRLDFLLTLLVGVLIAVSYSLIILYGIQAVFAGTLTTGLLIVFIFYLDNLTNPILSIIYATTEIRQSYIKIKRMNDFFDPKTALRETGSIKTIRDARIRFDRVSVRGKERGSGILHNISFEIEPGKRTVIFGMNGSGKTSVVNLIMRFIDKPSSGRIFLGNALLEQYDVGALREAIAFVPQEISLFNGTIRENIAFGNPQSTRAQVKEAARRAAADEFIEHLPGAYNFQVGEGGDFLSGGQRQRIMLSRALLKKDTKILLFDETLSALDVKTRREVLVNIYRFSKGKTAIIVSNIFDVVRAAENVIVLHRGRLIYSGPSSRLPREVALYKMIADNV